MSMFKNTPRFIISYTASWLILNHWRVYYSNFKLIKLITPSARMCMHSTSAESPESIQQRWRVEGSRWLRCGPKSTVAGRMETLQEPWRLWLEVGIYLCHHHSQQNRNRNQWVISPASNQRSSLAKLGPSAWTAVSMWLGWRQLHVCLSGVSNTELALYTTALLTIVYFCSGATTPPVFMGFFMCRD